jgi:hypothetical protein
MVSGENNYEVNLTEDETTPGKVWATFWDDGDVVLEHGSSEVLLSPAEQIALYRALGDKMGLKYDAFTRQEGYLQALKEVATRVYALFWATRDGSKAKDACYQVLRHICLLQSQGQLKA